MQQIQGIHAGHRKLTRGHVTIDRTTKAGTTQPAYQSGGGKKEEGGKEEVTAQVGEGTECEVAGGGTSPGWRG